MTIYEYLATDLKEIVNSKKYKSKTTKRQYICNRYNAAIANVLANADLTAMGKATIMGAKGLITKTIVDSLSDEDLKIYVENFVDPILYDFFHKTKY